MICSCGRAQTALGVDLCEYCEEEHYERQAQEEMYEEMVYRDQLAEDLEAEMLFGAD